MTLNLSTPEITELKPKILVIGIGGAGGNAVNNMILAELEGVEFVVANTDAQSLANSKSDRRIQLGAQITQGLGAGARPDIGAAAAQEAIDQIKEHLTGAHMAFITAGMGGGTGTGAAPVVAKLAREMGILTVGVVTKPFQFEGSRRMAIAGEGIDELHKHVDTLIIIPNQNLFSIANEKTTFAEAFAMADNVLHSGVRGITDLMVMPGLINLDFADVRTVMMEMGKAMMGTGEAEGETRALDAAEDAISNPLLDEISMKGAKGVLINITGGDDLTLFEVDEAANRIRSEVDPDANIIVGSTTTEALNGKIRVSVFATGIEVDPALIRSPSTTMTSMVETRPVPAPVEEPLTLATPAAAIADPVEERPSIFGGRVDTAPKSTPIDERAESPETPMTATRGPGDAFMAPRPMEKIDDYELSGLPETTAQPDPFAEAAMTNGAASEPVRESSTRGPSLFQRMTGRAKKHEKAAPTPEPELVMDDPAPAEPVEPVMEQTVAPVAPAPVAEEAEAPLTLRNVHPADRANEPRNPDAEEDQIDIPAFLRRQAN
ncbi:MAG: cell division protein FtsZ [Alphaproteobacteria bacterium]|nr:MAG: cell division protein FtsZ [Alphaproteobacteria bacterium]